MDMTGEHSIAAARETVRAACNDAVFLHACIPGCEEPEQTSDTLLSVHVFQRIEPVKAKCRGDVDLSKINAPASKLARPGSWVIISTAKNLVAQVFDNFQARLDRAIGEPAQ